MLRANLAFLVASLLTGLGNYAYQIVVGRLLSPTDYGAVAALISLYYVVLVPASVFSTLSMGLSTRAAASASREQIRGVYSSLTRQAAGTGLLISAVLIIFSRPIAAFLHIDSTSPLMLLAAASVLAVILPVPRGILQGTQRFGALSANTVLESMLKVVLAAGLILAGFGRDGALGALVLSSGIALLAARLVLRHLRRVTGIQPPRRQIANVGLPILVASLAMAVLQGGDVVIVRHLLQPHEAGLYSAMSTLGKLIFFVTASLAGVMFPVVGTLYHAGRPHRRTSNAFVAASASVSVVGIVLFHLCARPLVLGSLGPEYLAIVPQLSWFATAVGMLGVSNTLISYFLSTGRKSFLWPLALIAPAYPLVIWLLQPSSLSQVVQIDIALNALLLAALIAAYVRQGQAFKPIFSRLLERKPELDVIDRYARV